MALRQINVKLDLAVFVCVYYSPVIGAGPKPQKLGISPCCTENVHSKAGHQAQSSARKRSEHHRRKRSGEKLR